MRPQVSVDSRQVHRIGRLPSPWQWTPWQYAPFSGRWDDPQSMFRVLYTGASK